MKSNNKGENSVFNFFWANGLGEFSRICSRESGLSAKEISEISLEAIKYYSGSLPSRLKLRPMMKLEERWYKSLDSGNPDFSVYNDPAILPDVWACWSVYSRKYALLIKNGKFPGLVELVGSLPVIDLGCGFRYTSAALKEIFPNSPVIATNIENTIQFKIASEIGSKRGFSVSGFIPVASKCGLVFASEYFEHHLDPIGHATSVVESCNPKALVIASSFGSRSVGHFNKYLDQNGDLVSNKLIGRKFNARLRELGYEKVKTGLWNDRPSYWRKLD